MLETLHSLDGRNQFVHNKEIPLRGQISKCGFVKARRLHRAFEYHSVQIIPSAFQSFLVLAP